MAEFQDISCHPFLLSVLIIQGVGGIGGGVVRGGVGEWVSGEGGGKNHRLGHPIRSHDAHTVANNTP